MSAFPLELTPEAIARVEKLLAKSGQEGTFLRVGIKGGGCSGYEYVMKLDTKLKESDLFAQFGSAKVVCDPKSAILLEGSTLHHTGNLIGGGFEFNNPQVERSCGCGSSFTLKEGVIDRLAKRS